MDQVGRYRGCSMGFLSQQEIREWLFAGGKFRR
jgi:hypothetical protein